MKYKVTLFGVKTETYEIYEKFHNKIDLVVTLSSKAKKNYHISGSAEICTLVDECFEADNYKLDSDLCDSFFKDNEFDIGIVIGWQRLIPQKVLDNFKYGIFGFHASPLGLPFGKGRSPVNWSIILGHEQVYHHCFQYNSKADDGLIFSTTKLEIFPWDNIKSLKKKSLVDFEYTLGILIQDYENEDLDLMEQDSTKEETFFPKRTPKDGLINILEDSTKIIFNLIRGISKPFPGAFLNYGDNKVIIWKAQPFSYQLFKNRKAGEVVKIFKDKSFILKTTDGTLLVTDYTDVELYEGVIFSYKSEMIK